MKTRPEEELDEARLQALFERTAELPSGPTLTKLAARAADVPRARRRRFWLSLRFALPASAVVGLAVAAVLVMPQRGGRPGAPSAIAPIALAATSHTPVAPAVSAADPDELDSNDLVAGIELDDDGSELSLDLMHGPDSDAELDDWLAATAALLDEGG